MKTIALIGCSKTKIETSRYVSACELYSASQLFNARRRYVESRRLDWLILSAEYGAIEPARLVTNYDRTLAKISNGERIEWAVYTAAQLVGQLFTPGGELKPSGVTFEFHAGRDYFGYLGPVLESLGFLTAMPTRGLGIGEQMRFYKEKAYCLRTA